MTTPQPQPTPPGSRASPQAGLLHEAKVHEAKIHEAKIHETKTHPDKPLRILQVSARYLPYIGGTEMHTFEVSRRLAQRGFDVTVLTTNPGRRLAPHETSAAVTTVRVPAWPDKGDYYFAPGLARVISQGGWDIVHVQGYHTLVAPMAMLAASRAAVPFVLTFHSGGHSSATRSALRPLQWRLLRPLLARAERLVGVSQFETDLFRNRLGLPEDRFTVIPNGAHLPPAVEGAAHAESYPKDGPLIVSVGRLERYKGHQRVIAALPEVLKVQPDARLRIVGSGPYEPALRTLAQQLGVAARVDIRGIAAGDRQEMACLLAGASLVTLLSDYESQGIAVMEALVLKRPVLVSHATALGELADRGLARAVAPQSSAHEVAAAILGQLREPLIPSEVALPTWDGCAASLARLYHEVLTPECTRQPQTQGGRVCR